MSGKTRSVVQTILCFFVLSNLYGQIKFMDIGFGEYNRLGNAAQAIELIESNEPSKVLKYLSDNSKTTLDSLVRISNYINSIREDTPYYPPLIYNDQYESDTLFYERHYFNKIGENIESNAQIIILMDGTVSPEEILDVILKIDDGQIDRKAEILSGLNGKWWTARFEYYPKVNEY